MLLDKKKFAGCKKTMELNIRGNFTGGGLVIDKQEKVSLEKQSSSPWSSVRRTKNSPIRRYVIKRRWCIRVYGQLRSDKLLLLTFESVEPKIDLTAGAGSKKNGLSLCGK